MGSHNNKTHPTVILILSAILSLSLFGIMVYLFFNPKTGLIPLVFSGTKNSMNRLETNSLTIGVLGKPGNYTPLVEYLKQQLGDQVKITIDGNLQESYQEAKNKLARQKWDIAFTLSPMISVAAKDNGYRWVGRMFPQSPPYYQSALFVRKNSPIQSISDFQNTTVIALGDFNSASSFYMPTYDLFGKSLQVTMGYRGEMIQELVKSGKADVGAAAYEAVKNDPSFRIIQRSRNIPGSGVYLSPKLSDNDQKAITQALVNAPAKIQKIANYGIDQEPDFSYFIQISQKAEEVLQCADFTQNPVNFFCSQTTTKIQSPLTTPFPEIIGTVNGLSRVENQMTRLTLQGKDKKIYYVFLNPGILNQIPNAGSGLNLQNKTLSITGVIPKKQPNKIDKIVITDSKQMKVLN
ncbi:phosphate/phosphite/phosphonate ABC transporter substrate-binding protein [Planktothrix pseudagardhii]|uniref:Ser/Thr protein kinase n=1 Tax=Planktothrix pseudagardhii TaxID=132604 RepID=A0A9W4CWB3_9CYAN|nr:PhnD/SsuA/transferrin family substrate-binding protein [Planktothrix pseudagardhii]CAD5981902.1 Ser/Thr protein kinase [Planktothrix pseudagardhii]